MKPILAVLLFGTLTLAGCLDRANESQPSGSYPALQGSDVRGLTPEQIQGLRDGEGMGYALPAELNGYPGPKHVLELADKLGLNESQRDATAEVRSAMLAQAKGTGEALLTAYESLDAEFRSKEIDDAQLRVHTETIGRLEGELRAIHMSAHLLMMSILTHEQILEYSTLRGYGETGHTSHAH